MHQIVLNLINIENKVKLNVDNLKIKNYPKIIAVSKTFTIQKIMPLIDHGHIHFGENKVQEAVEKWEPIKIKNQNIKLHMIGRLQTNKIKNAVKLFDYIHSVDSFKIAKKISEEQIKIKKKIKIFLQVNVGDEIQKSGVKREEVKDLVIYCKKLNLDVLGLMCIPPMNDDPVPHFKYIKILNNDFGFNELSMGMSSDYLQAVENSATFLRIGSNIFGARN